MNNSQDLERKRDLWFKWVLYLDLRELSENLAGFRREQNKWGTVDLLAVFGLPSDIRMSCTFQAISVFGSPDYRIPRSMIFWEARTAFVVAIEGAEQRRGDCNVSFHAEVDVENLIFRMMESGWEILISGFPEWLLEFVKFGARICSVVSS